MAEIPDYSLGRAHGKIEIDYDGSGADKAARDLDKVAAEAQKTDASLSKTQGTLKDTEKEFDKAGSTAENYSKRIKDVDQAHTGLHSAHKQSSSDLQDFSRDAQKGENAAAGMANAVHDAARAVELLQPELAGAAEIVDVFAEGIGRKLGGAIGGSGQSLRDFGRHIADFEKSFAKISGMTLAVPSLAGLGGLAGGAGVQGLTAMIDSVRQLSGALGLLPAAIAGVGFSMGTLKVAFHGVSDALKDMMADDPKKFLDDIKNMGPAAAQAMLGVAQFRDQFKLAGAVVQDSFFKQISNDIAPLIQTWLPAVTSGMSKIATVFGQAAHQFAGLLEQPAMMQAFQSFVSNLATGMQALQPAMAPLLDIFTRLTTVGSGFFGEIGQRITQMMGFFDQIVSKAQASGALQRWIQSGIDAFSHLVNIAYLVGSTFNTILDVAEKFGGGGFLGWLEKVTGQFDAWTKSAAGQNVLQQFFSTTQQAMTAFAPMIQPIAQGITSLLTAFTKLGIGIAPGWQTFFNTFAQTMGQLGPQITALAPTLNQFLVGLSNAFAQLMASVGPQLPQIFQGLANAFLALLPQIGPLVNAFLQLVEQVGPQLPKFFGDVTQLIQAMMPFLPIIIGFVRDFVSVLTWFIGAGAGVIEWFTNFLGGVRDFVAQIPTVFGEIKDTITNFFKNLPSEAGQWGKDLLDHFIQGMKDGITHLPDALGDVGKQIWDFLKPGSPTKVGPLHDFPMEAMGAALVGHFAAGMRSAQSTVQSAALSTASAAASVMTAAGGAAASTAGAASSLGGAPAPSAGGSETIGNAMLPDNIANADVSILRAYQKHQFDPKRGLKGLATSLGQALTLSQTGFNLLNQYVVQSALSALNMRPGANDASWKKMTPAEQAAKAKADAEKAGPTWGDVLGQGSTAGAIPGMNLATGAVGGPSSSLGDALKAQGFSPEQIRLIQGFSQVEGNNPAGNPTLGFTDSQLGGATDVQSHVAALAKQFKDRASVAGSFPAGGTDQQQAQWIAKIVGQDGSASDWQGNAQPKDYVQRVATAMGAIPPVATPGKTWAQVGPQTAVPGMALATGAVPASTGSISENPASRATQVPNAPNVEAGIRAIGGLPTLYPTSGANAYQVPAWAQQLAKAFNLTASTYASGGSLHQMGYAFDFNDPNAPNGPSAAKEAFAQFVQSHLAQQTLQLIYRGQQDYGIASGQVTPASYYAGDLPGHTDHVHFATDQPVLFNGQVPPGSLAGPSGDPSGNLVTPGGKTLDQLTKSATANDRLLQAYLQGNPALAGQISAAQAPGASDTVVLGALNGIGKTIDGLKQQDAVGNKQTIDALSGKQSDIASQQGFSSGQSTLSTVSGALGGAANLVTGGFQIAQGVLDALSATQDIADRLVYGVANTEDVMKLVDDSQKYLSLAGDIANEVANGLSFAGNIAAAAGSGPDGGSPGGALQAAGSIAQLVAGGIQGVNEAIDYAQQIYEISMSYAGQFMSYLTAGVNGAPLMGNVQYLLNTNTGQLITSSLDNPQLQNQLRVPQWMQDAYGMGGGNANPGMGDLVIYAGPGQSPADMMNQAMWQVNTGNVGAAVAANF